MSLHLLLHTVDGISGSNSRMVAFAMTSTIPEQELYLCQQLIEPVRIVIDLHNDLLSWEEEIRAAQKTDQANSTNTIWERVEKQSLNKHDARTLCKNFIKKRTDKYLRYVHRDNSRLSPDLRRYMGAMHYYIGRNSI